MRTWIVLLGLVAVAVVVLVLALGGGPGVPDDPDAASTRPPDAPSEGTEPVRLAAPEPANQPPLEAFRIAKPTRVLLVAGLVAWRTAFLAQQWEAEAKTEVRSWVAPVTAAREGTSPPGGDVLPGALGRPPEASTLDEGPVDVLVVDDVDPALLAPDFWAEVAARVKDGRLGLLAVGGLHHGAEMLAHAGLGPLLPVAKASAVAGQPVAGTFQGLGMFKVTEEGRRHPATRLVEFPNWSRIIWDLQRTLETPWGTPFCYPVEEARSGAAVLLRAESERGEGWPAVIVGAPDAGRVLWVGVADLGGRAAYGQPRVVADWQVLVRNWVAWLAGQVP